MRSDAIAKIMQKYKHDDLNYNKDEILLRKGEAMLRDKRKKVDVFAFVCKYEWGCGHGYGYGYGEQFCYTLFPAYGLKTRQSRNDLQSSS